MVVGVVLTVALAACGAGRTSTTTPATGATAGSATGTSNSSAPAGSAAPSTAAQLAAQIRPAIARLRSARIVVALAQPAGVLTGVADERLQGGHAVDLQITQQAGATTNYHILVVGPRAWVMLPLTPRPWTVVSATSSKPVIRSLVGTIAGVRITASPITVLDYLMAATSMRATRETVVGAYQVQAYELVVDTARLPASNPSRGQLLSQGVRSFPVDLGVDAAGQPVRVYQALQAGGQTYATTITWSRLDQPVHITAPAPAEVGTD